MADYKHRHVEPLQFVRTVRPQLEIAAVVFIEFVVKTSSRHYGPCFFVFKSYNRIKRYVALFRSIYFVLSLNKENFKRKVELNACTSSEA